MQIRKLIGAVTISAMSLTATTAPIQADEDFNNILRFIVGAGVLIAVADQLSDNKKSSHSGPVYSTNTHHSHANPAHINTGHHGVVPSGNGHGHGDDHVRRAVKQHHNKTKHASGNCIRHAHGSGRSAHAHTHCVSFKSTTSHRHHGHHGNVVHSHNGSTHRHKH